VLATAEELPRTRDEALWAAEVAWLLSAAPGLRPAVRAAVLRVLSALATDPAFPPEERASLLAMLDELEPVPAY
jgi:uncharacterized protein (UPF0147 family)